VQPLASVAGSPEKEAAALAVESRPEWGRVEVGRAERGAAAGKAAVEVR